jgi:hypothetical protein
MSTILCKECEQTFPGDSHGESPEFDDHDCPASPGPPHKGESYADYSARCEAFRKVWRASKAQPQTFTQQTLFPQEN